MPSDPVREPANLPSYGVGEVCNPTYFNMAPRTGDPSAPDSPVPPMYAMWKFSDIGPCWDEYTHLWCYGQSHGYSLMQFLLCIVPSKCRLLVAAVCSGVPRRSVDPEVIRILLIRDLDHAKKHEKEERESCRLFCNEFLPPFRLKYRLPYGARTESEV